MVKNIGRYLLPALLLAAGVLGVISLKPKEAVQPVEPLKTAVEPSKSLPPVSVSNSSCTSVEGRPDPNCTPGAVNPDITQDNMLQNICFHGWSTKSIRPPVSYTNPLKLKLMAEYGFTDSPSNYELDHLIALTDGGNPTDPHNLWPEPASVIVNGEQLGFHEKDKVEVWAHKQICSGKMSLDDVRGWLSHDWVELLHRMQKDTSYVAPSSGVSQ